MLVGWPGRIVCRLRTSYDRVNEIVFMPLNDPAASLVAAELDLAQSQLARLDVVTQLDFNGILTAFVGPLTRLAYPDT